MTEKIPFSMTSFMMEAVQLLDEVNGMLSLERILHKIVRNLTQNLQTQTCAVIQINPQTELLEILNSQGLSWNFCKQYRRQILSPQIHELIWGGKSIVIHTVSEQQDLANDIRLENDFQSCIVVGLAADHKPLGMLYLDSNDSQYFDAEKQIMIQMYARIISIAIQKERMLGEIQRLAQKQTIDGIESYSYFYGRLQEAISRAQRLGESISVVLMDVVKFGNILSTYGLDVCKSLMNELVGQLRKNVRKYDNLSVFGTDEIILCLPGAGEGEATAATQKLYDVTSKSKYTKHDIAIELSIGIACFPKNANSIDGLLTATKNALVEAKRSLDSHIFISKTEFA